MPPFQFRPDSLGTPSLEHLGPKLDALLSVVDALRYQSGMLYSLLDIKAGTGVNQVRFYEKYLFGRINKGAQKTDICSQEATTNINRQCIGLDCIIHLIYIVM